MGKLTKDEILQLANDAGTDWCDRWTPEELKRQRAIVAFDDFLVKFADLIEDKIKEKTNGE